jgi:hypothetical protein
VLERYGYANDSQSERVVERTIENVKNVENVKNIIEEHRSNQGAMSNYDMTSYERNSIAIAEEQLKAMRKMASSSKLVGQAVAHELKKAQQEQQL